MRIKATDEGQFAICLFVAELMGHKGGTPNDKADFGKQCHLERKLPQLVLDCEHDQSELNELIWLERLYEELDQYALSKITGRSFYWSVPIELDASASMMSYIGLLLGDDNLLKMTNTVYSGKLMDPWRVHEVVPRNMNKCVVMKSTYGSSATPSKLLEDDGISYTLEQIQLMNESMTTGVYASANELKEFIIKNAKTSEVMSPTVYEDTFEVECNRFRNVGDYAIRYHIYDTKSKLIKEISHVHTHKEADLDQFRRYWMTGLVHSLDSQVLNYVMEKVMDKYKWAIDIHDAIIVSPEAAADVRRWYAEELQVIYDNRDAILRTYFESIGIDIDHTNREEWLRVVAKVTPITEPVTCSGWALK
jgi:hypothetical protein